MITTALAGTGTVVALGVLFLMAMSSVLSDVWDVFASHRRVP